VLAAGVSLGANALLKWLGETGAGARVLVRRAVAVSAPLDLAMTGAALSRGFSQFYGRRALCCHLRSKALDKLKRFPGAYDARRVRKARVLRDFEDAVTALVNGFRDAHDYWNRASAGPWLPEIRVPTLVLNARNDPFIPNHVLLAQEQRHRAGMFPVEVQLEFQEQGGHVGFPGRRNWLGRRVCDFLAG
jgi:predicted alpha/beta-fold hydrolase